MLMLLWNKTSTFFIHQIFNSIISSTFDTVLQHRSKEMRQIHDSIFLSTLYLLPGKVVGFLNVLKADRAFVIFSAFSGASCITKPVKRNVNTKHRPHLSVTLCQNFLGLTPRTSQIKITYCGKKWLRKLLIIHRRPCRATTEPLLS